MQSSNYTTNQRELILEFLVQNKNTHITVEELQFHLKNIGRPVSKSTIYRYFDLLINNGSIQKFTGTHGKSSCYQYVSESDNCHSHYHLICDECDQLLHLECEYLDKLNNHLLKSHEFQLNNFNTIFHGKCKKCSKEQAM